MEESLTYPLARTSPLNPAPDYARLRQQCPIATIALPSGPAWLVTTHEHVRQLLADPRISSDSSHAAAEPTTASPAAEKQASSMHVGPAQGTRTLPGLDPPEHTSVRRMVAGEFSSRRVQAMRPHIQKIVDACIDDMLSSGPVADLVQALALPVPSLVIFEMLGVPYSDREFLQGRMRRMLSRDADPAELGTMGRELHVYFDQLLTSKERNPGDDLLGRLLVKNRETKVFTHLSLVRMAFVLLGAGFETSANMIALGTIGLMENPAALDGLTSDPALTANAVEELLRFFTVFDTRLRYAADDIEVDGVVIHKGDRVLLGLGSANRDNRVFRNPDELDVYRDSRHHLAFSHGVHQCLGQGLARLELEVTFSTLFARIPGLRLARPVAQLPFKHDGMIYGLHELPVTW